MATKGRAGVPQAGRRRGKRFHRAGGALGDRLAEAAARRGFAEPDVLLRWPEIVGADLARACRPVRVSYGGRSAPGLGATLLVQVTGASASRVEHMAPGIVERVNAFFGYRAIARIRLTQATGRAGAVRGFAEEAAGFAGPGPASPVPPAEPDPETRARAEALVAGIERPGLRAVLVRLGARILAGGDGR